MFLDATPNEAYNQGRLKTVETENGVQLVAYHEHVLAQVNDAGDSITLFTGHYGAHSETVTRYISELGSLLNERPNFDVTVLDGYAPTTGYGRVAEAGQYINEYVGDFSNLSKAERSILQDVNAALASQL